MKSDIILLQEKSTHKLVNLHDTPLVANITGRSSKPSVDACEYHGYLQCDKDRGQQVLKHPHLKVWGGGVGGGQSTPTFAALQLHVLLHLYRNIVHVRTAEHNIKYNLLEYWITQNTYLAHTVLHSDKGTQRNYPALPTQLIFLHVLTYCYNMPEPQSCTIIYTQLLVLSLSLCELTDVVECCPTNENFA